ncbi:MAG: DUF692 domain-containing protein [Anaerolineaceae bacterium]|nr:DUF692 domain-containing protein [Anaerolineaceae bacterium]
MKFAVNYSTPLKELIEQGEVRVDLLKCPDWDGIVKAAGTIGEVYIHFDIALGAGSVKKLDFALIDRLLYTTVTPHLNTHLSNHPSLEHDSPVNRKILLNRWKEDVACLRRNLPGVKIITENLPWHEQMPELKMAADPAMIADFIEESGLGLLLDLSHVQISARLMEVDPKDYVRRLPLDRLAELHLTGVRHYGGFLTDHFELQPQDWPLAKWAAEQLYAGAWRQPEIVAFEYGGVGDVFCWRTEPSALKAQVPLLYEMFGEQRKISAYNF